MKLEIEVFRIFSAFGIVWFHSGLHTGRQFAYGGLIYFIIISIFFTLKSKNPQRLSKRFKKLILPFILWTLFYGFINFLFNRTIFPDGFEGISIILTTTSIHLWYLPFVFILLIILDCFKLYFSRISLIYLFGVSAIILLYISPIWRNIDFIIPFAQYAHALPAAFIGIFISSKIHTKLWFLIMFGIVTSLFRNFHDIGITYISGLLPCIFLFVGHEIKKPDSIIFKISSATFGVYLLHPFILNVLKHIGVEYFWLPIFAFFISLAIILIAKFVISIKVLQKFLFKTIYLPYNF